MNLDSESAERPSCFFYTKIGQFFQISLALAVTTIMMIPVAHAAGQSVHLRIANEALKYLDDPLLEAHLRVGAPNWYRNGTSFPDAVTFYVYQPGSPPDTCGDCAHTSKFLTDYITEIANRCGRDPSVLTDNGTCGRWLAHFMGVLAHRVGDARFDRYFLLRADQECGYYDQGSSGGSQGFTDQILDNAYSDVRPDVRPAELVITQLPIELLEMELDQASYHISGLNSFIRIQPSRADNARKKIRKDKKGCEWALDNLPDALGGPLDSGRVLADYINKTWELLTATGGAPAAVTAAAAIAEPDQEGRQGGRERRETSVRRNQQRLSSSAPDSTHFTFGLPRFQDGCSRIGVFLDNLQVVETGGDRPFDFMWVEAKRGVSKFHIEGGTIAVLADGLLQTLPVTELRDARGPFDANSRWDTLQTDVVDFQIEKWNGVSAHSTVITKTRYGALLLDRRLLVREDYRYLVWDDGGLRLIDIEVPFVEVASDVRKFELESDRIAVLRRDHDRRDHDSRDTRQSRCRQHPDNSAGFGRRASREDCAPPREPFNLFSRNLLIKEGSVDAPWIIDIKDKIIGFDLEAVSTRFRLHDITEGTGRVAVLLRTPGQPQQTTLIVKEGGLYADWVELHRGRAIDQLQMVGAELLGVLVGGELLVKKGPLDADWESMAFPVSQFLFEPNAQSGFRLGTVRDGSFYVGNGQSFGEDVIDFDLNDPLGQVKPGYANRGAVLQADGKLLNNGIGGNPPTMTGCSVAVPDDRKIRQFEFNEEWLGVLVGDSLYVKTVADYPF